MKKSITPQALEEAFLKNQFILYYQPKYDLEEEKIIGLEALIRWQHPYLGEIGPNDFFEDVFKLGKIIDLDIWVLHKAIEDIWKMEEDKLYSYPVAINLSAKSLCSVRFMQEVESLFINKPEWFNKLEIELTEEIRILDFSHAQRNIEKLRQYGMKIAIDDFGKGFANIECLRKLNFDILKIDKDLIRDIHKNEISQALLDFIIQMANVLELSIIAEGIESREEYEYIKYHTPCHIIQGYYIGKPSYLSEFYKI